MCEDNADFNRPVALLPFPLGRRYGSGQLNGICADLPQF